MNGDNADAAAAAAGKGMAIVWVNDQAVPDGTSPTSLVSGIGPNYVDLIKAVSAANPNTVVVLQSAYADTVDTWLPNVKALLETWNSGQEGAVATARLLLGHANPSGHTAMTWPKGPSDSIWGYNETTPLYPGDTTGTHPERLNGAAGGGTNESEGIYTGYRFFDKEGLTPEFPFGFGLSYTTFGFSKLKVHRTKDGGLDVGFRVDEHRRRGRRRRGAGVRRPAERSAGRRAVRRAVARAVRSRRRSLRANRRRSRCTSTGGRSPTGPRRSRSGSSMQTGAPSPSATPMLSRTCRCRRRVHAPGKGDVTCSNEQINAAAIDGNLKVEKGDWCDLVDVTVNGDLHIARDERREAPERRRRGQRRTSTMPAPRPIRSARARTSSARARSATTSSSTTAPRVRRGASGPAGRTRSATTSTSTTTEAATTSRATRSGTT